MNNIKGRKTNKGMHMVGTFFLWASLATAWMGILFCFFKKENGRKWVFFFVIVSVVFVFIAFGMYVYVFVQNQFQYVNVWNHSNRAMNSLQLIACSWSGQSGSLFLWLLCTQITLLIALKDTLLRNEISFFLLLLHSIILILLLQAQPFQTHSMQIADGIGMNPVLSHPLMVTHPPFAFVSYAFLGLYCSVGMGALLKKQEFHWISRYNYALYIALFGLTVTMVLGSLWAYEITGWGGYWSFDPVESGSLSLWFSVLMLIHLYPFFQKWQKGRIWFYWIPIFFVFSMFYVSFLIRSGLLESFTAHTYAQGSLVVVLYGIVVLLLLVPSIFLWRNYPRLSLTPCKKELSKVHQWEFFTILMLGFLAILLFWQVTLPVFTKQIQLSDVLIQIFVGFFLVTVTLSLYRLFWVKQGFFIFLKSNALALLGVLFLYWQYSGLNDIPHALLSVYVLYIAFLWSFYWVVQYIKKMTLRSLGMVFVHVAIGLLLIGVFVNTPLLAQEVVFLTPDTTHSVGPYLFSQKKEVDTVSMYVGHKKTSPIVCVSPYSGTTILQPSLWHYNRNFINYSLPIPAMLFQWKEDLQIIPFAESGILLEEDEVVLRDAYEYQLLDFESAAFEKGFVLEKASIRIHKSNQPTSAEEIHMQRILHPSGKQLTHASVYSNVAEDYVHWVDTMDKGSIVLMLDRDQMQNKFEIRFKPGMFWVRSAYWLLILGCLFLILSLIMKPLKKMKKRVQ
ncbi:MAG: cytochrome c biogenesis protein CcsA [Caldisericia bacterium]|nr:cytochrome c biogenesis protein CcsA [Caldisericia bacterium]